MVTDSGTINGNIVTGFVTIFEPRKVDEYGELWDKHEALKKEVIRLKKELSKRYLTRGPREFLKKGSF